MEDLREMAGSYKGKYHVARHVDHIENYRCRTMTGRMGMYTGIGAQGGSDWSVGGI